MNRSIKSGLLSIIGIISINTAAFIGCENDKESNNILTSQEIILAHEIESEELEDIKVGYQFNAIFLEGDFKVFKSSKKQLVIYTETIEAKHLFLFKGVSNEIIEGIKIEKLYYLQHGVLINEQLFLGVKGNVHGNMKRDLTNLAKNNSYKAFMSMSMLSHKWYPKKNSDFKDISTEELISKTLREGFDSLGHEGSCDSGGEGSNGCGTPNNGCTVSCGDGYYACCLSSTPSGDCHCHPK